MSDKEKILNELEDTNIITDGKWPPKKLPTYKDASLKKISVQGKPSSEKIEKQSEQKSYHN